MRVRGSAVTTMGVPAIFSATQISTSAFATPNVPDLNAETMGAADPAEIVARTRFVSRVGVSAFRTAPAMNAATMGVVVHADPAGPEKFATVASAFVLRNVRVALAVRTAAAGCAAIARVVKHARMGSVFASQSVQNQMETTVVEMSALVARQAESLDARRQQECRCFQTSSGTYIWAVDLIDDFNCDFLGCPYDDLTGTDYQCIGGSMCVLPCDCLT